MSPQFAEWSKDALIRRVQDLEAKLSTTPTDMAPKRLRKVFDFAKVAMRPIALKVLYLGWDYRGNTFQSPELKDTVEVSIWDGSSLVDLPSPFADCFQSTVPSL